MGQWFFASGELGDGLDAHGARMRQAIEAEPEGTLNQADAEAWAQALAHHFAVSCPVLRRDEVWREPVKDVTIHVSRETYLPGSPLEFPGYRVVVHVPYEGDATIFKLRTSSFTTTHPRGDINANDVALTIDYPRSETPDIDATAAEFISLVDRYLGWAREQIESFNGRLEQEALHAIQSCRQRIADRDAHLAESKIPERRPGEEGKTYIADALVRLPAPLLPATRGDDKPPALEPVLDERVFEHILEVTRRQGLNIEQAPSTFAGMGEEDLRNVILGALTTHYDGFTAETNNRGGHTDIIARHEGRNVFIGECKIWDGVQSFSNAVDQLFDYTGWRDTKLALIIFVRAKDLTAIIHKGAEALASHAQFAEPSAAANETELRAVMRWPGDDERYAHLNVFFVHIAYDMKSRAVSRRRSAARPK